MRDRCILSSSVASRRSDSAPHLLLHSALWRVGPAPLLSIRSELALDVGLVGQPAPKCMSLWYVFWGPTVVPHPLIPPSQGVQMPLQAGLKCEEEFRTGGVLQDLFGAKSELEGEVGIRRRERPSLRIFNGRALLDNPSLYTCFYLG